MAGLVQIGLVSDVDRIKRCVRVLWPDSGQTSGWLYILQQSGAWLPDINDRVLVLYLPAEDGDGFVVGRIS